MVSFWLKLICTVWVKLVSVHLCLSKLAFYIGEKFVHTIVSLLTPLQAASSDAQTFVSTVKEWEVAAIVCLVTFTAAWRSPQGLVIVTRGQEAVTEGGAGRAVAVPPAGAWAPVVVIHVCNLLFSAGISRPLRGLKYVIFTSWNKHWKSFNGL